MSISLNNILTELFDKTYPYTQISENEFSFITPNQEEFQVDIVKILLVEFNYMGKKIPLIIESFGYEEHDIITETSFGKGKNYVTGIDKTEDYIGVLSTVIKIMKEHIKEEDPMIFSAKQKESSRVKLYDRLVMKKLKRPNDKILKFDDTVERVYLLLSPKLK